MKPTERTSLLLLALLLAGGLRGQDVWKTGISAKTTEAQIVRAFGNPHHVEILNDAFATIRAGKAAEYRFVYALAGGPSSLMDEGPLGEAASATVYFAADRTVKSVQWKYAEGYRYHKRTAESRTPITKQQIEALAGKAPITVTKIDPPPDDAKVYDFDVGPVQVRVFYLGPGNEVMATATYQ